MFLKRRTWQRKTSLNKWWQTLCIQPKSPLPKMLLSHFIGVNGNGKRRKKYMFQWKVHILPPSLVYYRTLKWIGSKKRCIVPTSGNVWNILTKLFRRLDKNQCLSGCPGVLFVQCDKIKLIEFQHSATDIEVFIARTCSHIQPIPNIVVDFLFQFQANRFFF